jgi:hypothetical protein
MSADVTGLVCPLGAAHRVLARGWEIAFTGAMGEATQRPGYALSSLDEMGEGPGFRKVRRELGVTAFGINAVVLPAGYSTGVHYHEEQEETYFVHCGRVEFRFGDGTTHEVGPGGLVRVDASTEGCATSATTKRWSWSRAARTGTWDETDRPWAAIRAAVRRAEPRVHSS